EEPDSLGFALDLLRGPGLIRRRSGRHPKDHFAGTATGSRLPARQRGKPLVVPAVVVVDEGVRADADLRVEPIPWFARALEVLPWPYQDDVTVLKPVRMELAPEVVGHNRDTVPVHSVLVHHAVVRLRPASLLGLRDFLLDLFGKPFQKRPVTVGFT